MTGLTAKNPFLLTPIFLNILQVYKINILLSATSFSLLTPFLQLLLQTANMPFTFHHRKQPIQPARRGLILWMKRAAQRVIQQLRFLYLKSSISDQHRAPYTSDLGGILLCPLLPGISIAGILLCPFFSEAPALEKQCQSQGANRDFSSIHT